MPPVSRSCVVFVKPQALCVADMKARGVVTTFLPNDYLSVCTFI